MPNYFNNQNMMEQLLRQRDNVENLIQQYSQMPQQAPIQNIINQGASLDFEAKILNNGENPKDILINKRTMMLDLINKKLLIKELDGSVSAEYDIIIPLDEKDKKILELEQKIKDMEEKANVKYEKSNVADNEVRKPSTNDIQYDDTSTTTNGKDIFKQP